jgi:hypothetical protein
MVAVNRLTGHSPGFFSVYTLPPELRRRATLSAMPPTNRVDLWRDLPAVAGRAA